MEGGSFGFPFGGDPEDLLRGIQEFAAQQAESVQEAQREQFATLTLNTAVELTSAALKQVQPSGSIDEQAVALRDAMRVLFPEAVALVRPPARASCASADALAGRLPAGGARLRRPRTSERTRLSGSGLPPTRPPPRRAPGRQRRLLVAPCPCSTVLSSRCCRPSRSGSCASSLVALHRRLRARGRAPGRRGAERGRQARDRRRPGRGGHATRPRPRRSQPSTLRRSTPSSGTTSTRTSASSRPGSA